MAKTTTTTTPYNKQTDNELRALLHERMIEMPVDEDNKLIRKIAIAELKKWDSNNVVRDDKKMRVVFHRSPSDAAAESVFLALNGTAYQAPYEKEVVLPESVIRACCDCAMNSHYRNTGKVDANNRVIYDEEIIHTQPYTFLGYVEEK